MVQSDKTLNDGCPNCGCEDFQAIKTQRIERTNSPVLICELNQCNFCGNQFRTRREEIVADDAAETEIGLP